MIKYIAIWIAFNVAFAALLFWRRSRLDSHRAKALNQESEMETKEPKVGDTVSVKLTVAAVYPQFSDGVDVPFLCTIGDRSLVLSADELTVGAPRPKIGDIVSDRDGYVGVLVHVSADGECCVELIKDGGLEIWDFGDAETVGPTLFAH